MAALALFREPRHCPRTDSEDIAEKGTFATVTPIVAPMMRDSTIRGSRHTMSRNVFIIIGVVVVVLAILGLLGLR